MGVSSWHPDWAAYAELCGATGISVDGRGQLDRAMTRLFAAARPRRYRARL